MTFTVRFFRAGWQVSAHGRGGFPAPLVDELVSFGWL